MKFLPALLLFFVFPIQIPRPQSAQRSERVSLELGSITVWLGMPREEAVKKFRDAGYKIVDSADSVSVASGEESHLMKFANSRLVYADLEWYTSNSADGLDAVMGALGALTDKSSSPCSVLHQPISDPNMSMNRIFVSCGERSVLIGKGTFFGNSIEQVSERIGDFPTDSEK